MCQWSLRRVVDSVDLGFDYRLYSRLSLSLSLRLLTVLFASMNPEKEKW